MQDYQKRVIEEKQELDARLDKLNHFVQSKHFLTIPEDEQERLQRQQGFMIDYSKVLGERIEAFK